MALDLVPGFDARQFNVLTHLILPLVSSQATHFRIGLRVLVCITTQLSGAVFLCIRRSDLLAHSFESTIVFIIF